MRIMLTIILCALAAMAGAITNQTPTNVLTTSAWARVSISAGTPVLQLHFGMIDAGTNLTWTSTNAAITGAVGTASQQITNLTKSSRYYYRFRNNSATNWAAGGSIRFYTAADSPTGTPSPSANALMVHPTTAVLLAPTNFFGANTGALNTAIGGLYDPTGAAAVVAGNLTSVSNDVAVIKTNYAQLPNFIAVSNALDTAELNIGAISTKTDVAYGWASTNYMTLADGNNVSGRVVTVEGWGDWGTNFGTNAGQIYDGANGAFVSNLAANAATGTPVYAESDPNWAAVSNSITEQAGHGETAYGWGNHATNDYSTGTPVYVESDPVWDAAKTNYLLLTGGIMTGPLTNEAGFHGDGSGLTNLPGASGFPLTQDVNLAGFSLTNGSFVGNAPGLTNNLKWDQASTDATSWTNNALALGNATNLTNNVKWDQAATDAATWTNNKLAWNDGGDLTNVAAADLSGWSGYAATQPVFQVFIITNLIYGTNQVTVSDGDASPLNPVVNGIYTNIIADYPYRDSNYPAYHSTNGYSFYRYDAVGGNVWVFPDAVPADPVWYFNSEAPTGTWALGSSPDGMTGLPYVVYSGDDITTNVVTNTFRFGVTTAQVFQISQDGTNSLRSYVGASNVFEQPVYIGQNKVLTNEPDAAVVAANFAAVSNRAAGAITNGGTGTVSALAVSALSLGGNVNASGQAITNANYVTTTNIQTFMAWRNNNQPITNNVWTKLLLTNEVNDIGAVYNNSSCQFNPTIVGSVYAITLSVCFDSSGMPASKNVYAVIYKNGALYKANLYPTVLSKYATPTVTIYEYISVSTNIYEPYTYSETDATNSVLGNATYTFFNCTRVQ